MAKAEKLLAHRLVAGLERDVRPGEHAAAPPHPPGAAGAHPVQGRRGLHDQGRPGRHRRRVHRPTDAGPPLERWAAPGRRSQGEGQDRAREPDARHHHLPELLPQVQEALRHDRHRRDRGRGIRQDLQPRRHRRRRRTGRWRRKEEPDSVYRPSARNTTRSSTTSSRSRPPAGRRSSARSRSRSPRTAVGHAQAARRQARRAEREVSTRRRRKSSPRPAAATRSPSPRTWPAAAPTSCSAATPSSWRASRRWPIRSPSGCRRARRSSSTTTSSSISSTSTPSTACRSTEYEARFYAALKQQTDAEHEDVVQARRPAHHRHGAPRGAAHRQPVARPRRPSGRSGVVTLLPVARRRPDAHLRHGSDRRADGTTRDGRRRADRARHGSPRPSSAPRSRSKPRTSPPASICSSTTTS